VSKKLIGFIIAASALILLAVLAYTSLEVRPRTFSRPPSREVLVNNFFALETWLRRTGHPVRFIKRGDPYRIIEAPEKTVFLQASAFDWENAGEPLKNWIAAGGFLLVSLEPPPYEDADLAAFLEGFGISPAFFDGFPDDTGEGDGETAGHKEEPPPEPAPDFDPALWFSLPEEPAAPAFIIKGGEGLIRLAGIPLGAGAAVFIGTPRFMENDYLEREANARLAWELTGARTGGDTPGVLFIRGRRQVKSLFGRLADRGNFLPLGVSLLILITTGFWMVIPPFGLLFQEKKASGRPIRDRLLAEIRFLKKYRALETYPEVYIREIKRKLRGRETGAELEAVENALKKALKTKGALPYKDLILTLQKLETIMERL
jgi:hypothetical protein